MTPQRAEELLRRFAQMPPRTHVATLCDWLTEEEQSEVERVRALPEWQSGGGLTVWGALTLIAAGTFCKEHAED